MLNVQMIGDKELVARFRAMPSALRAALIRKTSVLTLMLEAKVKAKLSGQVLNVVTGALRRSIQRRVTSTESSVKGEVYSAGDVKYAGIHEHGGTTPPHTIIPNKAQALSFVFMGKQAFFAKVNHPGSKIPERSYMRSSLREMRETIVSGYRDVIIQTARGNK